MKDSECLILKWRVNSILHSLEGLQSYMSSLDDADRRALASYSHEVSQFYETCLYFRTYGLKRLEEAPLDTV